MGTRIREDTDAEKAARWRRYQDKMADLMAQGERLQDAQIAEMLETLAKTRARIVVVLSQLPPDTADTFKAFQLGNLRDAVDREAARLARGLTPQMQAAIAAAWDFGDALLPVALDHVGIDLVVAVEVPRLQMVVAQRTAAALVVDVGERFRTEARRLVTQAVVGEQSRWSLMKAIEKLLPAERPEGKLGTYGYQAERIVRTEMANAARAANEIRQRAVGDEVPGLKKIWKTVGDSRVRPAHADAGKRYAVGGNPGPIPVGQNFVVGGGFINCRCHVQSWHADWFPR